MQKDQGGADCAPEVTAKLTDEFLIFRGFAFFSNEEKLKERSTFGFRRSTIRRFSLTPAIKGSGGRLFVHTDGPTDPVLHHMSYIIDEQQEYDALSSVLNNFHSPVK